MNGGWGVSYEIALRWMPLDLTDDKSTLVQVKAWCSQATSHYLSQCWPRSMLPNGVTRPQWVKSCRPYETFLVPWTVQNWFRCWLAACSAPSHYLNQCWLIGPRGTKIIEILFKLSYKILHSRKCFWKYHCKMEAILLSCHWVDEGY